MTFVQAEIPSLHDLPNKTAFPVVLHEAAIDLPAYLAVSGASNITLQSLASLAMEALFGTLPAPKLAARTNRHESTCLNPAPCRAFDTRHANH